MISSLALKLKLLLVFCIISSFLFAQDIKKSNVFIKIDGKEYYVHTVKKKETLYRIAKSYNVSTEEIVINNPEAKNKIKVGQKLQIPNFSTPPKQVVTEEIIEYKVEKGDNISAIARKFETTKEIIFSANPGLTDKIKPDQLIKIPVKISKVPETVKTETEPEPEPSEIISYDCGEPKFLDSYNIALMVPFYLDDMYKIKTEGIAIKEKDASDYASFTFIQFYEGVLMALDSLKKKGFSAKIYVYDVDDDSSSAINILNKPELAKMHLIIGPFHESSQKVIARFAKKHDIKMLDPVSMEDNILKGNPLLFKASPSTTMQLKQLAVYIAEKYPTKPIIIVHNNEDNDKKYCQIFENSLNQELKKIGKKDSSYHKVIYRNSGISGVTKVMSKVDTNIVITLSNGEVFVTGYVSNLYKVSNDYKMIVFGLPTWKSFDNIETDYLQNINLHMFSPSFIDYMDENVKQFILSYRQQYKTEPDKYAFLGYDLGMFFFSAFMKYGLHFEKCVDKMSGNYLQSNYRFRKTSNKDGFDNSFLNIYRYEEYRFIDSRKYPKLKEKEEKKKK